MSGSTEEKDGIRYSSDFNRIEELIKGNSFSREEISHLVEILNSRVENEKEKQKSSIYAEGDAPLVSWTREMQRSPPQEKLQDVNKTMVGTFQRDSDVSLGVGASPIDIARAYMARRTSNEGLDQDNLISKCERSQPSNEFIRKQILPSPFPKPSICWPGAIVHDPHGYATPQNQRSGRRLHDISRTPYSRSTLWKSTTKLQAESRSPYTSTPLQPSRTSLYEQVKSRGNNADGYGSVGPIRRIRNKFSSEFRPRGSIFLTSSTDTPSIIVAPKDSGGFLPNTEKDLEPGETSGASKQGSGDNVPSSSDRSLSNPRSSPRQAVTKILEHLDRSKPTPKEKEAELKLATSWRQSSIEASDTIHREDVNSVRIGELASHKNTNTAGQNIQEDINESSKSKFLVNYNNKGANEVRGVVNGNEASPSSVSTRFSILPGGNSMLSFGLMGSSGPVAKNVYKSALFTATNDGQTIPSTSQFSHPQPSDGKDAKSAGAPTGFELPKDNVIKPSLPSISIKKPDFRSASFDNGPGFTFPVSASGVLSEMPTPSITPPPSSVSFLSQPVAQPTELPPYTFGTNKSAPRLVFSFPSSSSTPADANMDSDLKFSFGSDKKTTVLSFCSFGKDAICY